MRTAVVNQPTALRMEMRHEEGASHASVAELGGSAVMQARRRGTAPRFGLGRAIEDVSAFPGWERFGPFVRQFVADGAWVVDLGGGAWPKVDPEPERGVRTVLVDIDEAEIEWAAGNYTRAVVADATTQSELILDALDGGGADLVLSHMFLEHITRPDALHRTILDILKPGGRAIHAYPIPNNLPLVANALLPERVSRALVRLMQPARKIEAAEGKFPAFYKRCHPPSRRARDYFHALGFRIESHTAFAGHGYFNRLPPAAALESVTRRAAIALQFPLVSFCILVLSKPGDANRGRVA
jgi:SAM-dependent methyltransferase